MDARDEIAMAVLAAHDGAKDGGYTLTANQLADAIFDAGVIKTLVAESRLDALEEAASALTQHAKYHSAYINAAQIVRALKGKP